MRYYTVCLDINDKECLVVGGGEVATRKVATLLECGARVTVVAPSVTEKLGLLAEQNKITLRLRPYEHGDLDGMFLVIGATADTETNLAISGEAQRRNMLCNIADVPEACNFILPAIVKQGDLQIAISTSGKSPAFAKHLRKKLESQFGKEYATFLELMGRVRKRLLSESHEPEAHRHLFEQLIASGIPEMISQKNSKGIDKVLVDILGDRFSLDTLGIAL